VILWFKNVHIVTQTREFGLRDGVTISLARNRCGGVMAVKEGLLRMMVFGK
jgi:hypothetical protein